MVDAGPVIWFGAIFGTLLLIVLVGALRDRKRQTEPLEQPIDQTADATEYDPAEVEEAKRMVQEYLRKGKSGEVQKEIEESSRAYREALIAHHLTGDPELGRKIEEIDQKMEEMAGVTKGKED